MSASRSEQGEVAVVRDEHDPVTGGDAEEGDCPGERGCQVPLI
jgi:hypothetical protein